MRWPGQRSGRRRSVSSAGLSGTAVAQAFAAAAAVFLAIGLLVVVERATPHKIGTYVLSVGSSASIQLGADSQGQALFPNSVLGPGHDAVNCLRVKYAGTDGSGHLTLQASALAGPLLPYMQVEVERGTGGQFGNCTGFSGHLVYSGSLTGLTSAPGETWNVSNGDVSTYRVTVSVTDDPAAQGQGASGEFDMSLSGFEPGGPTPTPSPVPPTPVVTPSHPGTPAPTPSVTPTPTTSPSAAATGLPLPSSAPTAGPTGTAAPGSPTGAPTTRPRQGSPTPSHSAVPAGPPSQGSGGAGGGAKAGAGGISGLLHTVWPKAREVLSVLTRQPARRAEIPVTGLIFILLFLLIQDQIDRREPKLALAPLHPATLQFSATGGSTVHVSLAAQESEPDHDGTFRPDSEPGGESR